MNWFTTDYIERNSVAYKKERAEEDSCCEHVEADPACATHNRKEMDSFGPVSTHVVCEACNILAEEAELEEEDVCQDCHQTVKMRDAISWKPYDFYAPAGEEPLIICNACRKLEKHITRVKRDQADYEREMASYDHG